MQLKNLKGAEKITRQEEYWLKRLAGDLEKSNFPSDYKILTSSKHDVKQVEFEFPTVVSSELLKFCRHSNLKLFKFLVSALVILLDKYSFDGLKDVVIGAPICMCHPITGEILETIPVNKAVVLRNFIHDQMSFNELLIEARQTVLSAFENQDYAIEDILTQLKLTVSESEFPLFDVAICLDSLHDKRNLDDIPLNMLFTFSQTDSAIKGAIDYNSTIYEESTVKRIITHLINLLEAVLFSPGMDAVEISILSKEEKKQLIHDFNNFPMPYPEEKTMIDVFEEQVKKTPDAIAVSYLESQVSYRNLDQLANRLARVLRAKGVTCDKIVGLMVERSVEMIAAMVGILKAGGAYLPIGLTLPEARRDFMLEDSQAEILLTQKHLMPEDKAPKNTVYLEDVVISGDSSQLDSVIDPNSLAYIIYTSGTTGKPKGVMVEHRNVVNLVFGLQERIFGEYGSNQRVVLLAPYIFDASVQLFGAILLGHTLYIVPEDIRVDGGGLVDFLTKYRIEISDGTPSHLRLMLGVSQDKPFEFITKHFMIGGEALSKQVVDAFINNFSTQSPVVTNVYGPTECCVDSTSFRITKENLPQLKGDIISIGKPMPNEHVFIVNKKIQLQPMGVPGELCIGGDGVARGYLGRRDLTAEKFIPHPLFDDKTLYRTGDIARWLPDGNIVFMDRIDHQVKIRGFRIEIGEIESLLLKQPSVRETVVLARDDDDGEKFLCAYFVPEKGVTIDIPKLQNVLAGALPSYMVPSHFVEIEEIPLTPNGKVDRKKLPEPQMQVKSIDYIAPRNELEEKMVEIWAKVLRIDKSIVGIDESFFRLGGHSLKAGVMITLIHKNLDVKLSMSDIFEKPTIRELGELINGAEAVKYSAIEPAPKKYFYPQTSEQKRLYFFTQLEKNSILYNMPLMDIYHKNTSKEKLEEVCHKLLERHESLRTSFHFENGEAVQKVHELEEILSNFEIEFYETDENGMISSDQPGKEWTQVTGLPFQDVVEHFVRPFDLSQAPLIRVGLVNIAGAIQILMLDQHHICGDGVSLVILIDELWKLCDGIELEPVKVQYKDYAEWRTKDEQKEIRAKQETFWLDHFAGELPLLALPTDYQRPTKMSFEGDTVFFEIGRQETELLNQMAVEKGETLFMILFAIFNVLMARLSGQEDIIVGTVTAGRNHAEIQECVGMFVDTLALRNFPTGDKRFRQFLEEVKDRTIAAFENQDYPLEELVKKFANREDRSRNPLFDVVFELENEDDRTEFLLEALMMDQDNPYSFRTKTSKFDMLLVAIETPTGMQFKIEYSTNLFKEETIKRFVGYFSKIIRAVCSDDNQKISEIDMVPEDERKLILHDFNAVQSAYPHEKTIQELFEEQVAKTPENVAVVFYDHDNQTRLPITYRALNRKSDQLAHLLTAKGVTSESIVGIMCKKSREMIIGILSILKAGGAYLPLNPDYPVERKKFIIDDCAAEILLTNFKDSIDWVSTVIDLDEDIYKSKEPFRRDYSNDRLAYIMYTSGSTGKPKGVMIDQVSVVRLVKNANYFDFREDEKILQTGALEFDASTFEVWGCLLNGACFYLVPKNTILNAETLKTTMKINGITTIWMTSALFNQMLDTDPDIFSGLRYLLTGGDIVSKSHVKRLREHVPGITVLNMYGPTENTTFSTFKPIVKDYIESLPIGGPVSNSTCYILDKFKRPVPIGVGGELYVGGDGVARGYLNNPEMTTDKFFPDPFIRGGVSRGSMMYASGDLARWLPNGDIEFLGRIDFQVKIRGFRIEPGEIDNQLMKIEYIDDAAVIARKNPETGHHYLCAYFSAQEKVNISALKETMLKDLPPYMIPTYFMQMDSLPLNSNGKVDRKALPEPNMECDDKEYAVPETENEKILAEIWQEVLGMKRISIDDNFFEIGGDSIKTILISARLLKQRLQTNVNDMFSFPTIRQLAKQIKTIEREIDQGSVSGEVELTPIHKWYFQKSFKEKHHFNHFVLPFSEAGFDEHLIRKVFTRIVEHHDSLRLVYIGDGESVVQKNRPPEEGKLFDLDIIDLKDQEEFAPRMTKEANKIQREIDLENGPLVKLGLFRTRIGDYLLVVIHHNVVDGVSWRILFEDFETGYRQALNGEEIKFQDKTDSFKDWAAKLKTYADSPTALEELPYWKSIEDVELSSLDRDYIVDKKKQILGNREIVLMNLSKEDTDKLLKEANWVYNTEINDLLLTALALTVKEWSGKEIAAINLEGHGREAILEEIDISRTIGWFTSQYPLLLKIPPLELESDEELEERIREVKEALRRVPKKGIGYGILRYLTSDENKDNTIFKLQPEISFNYLGQMGE